MLLGSAVAALACWTGLPGTAIDRLAFTSVARGFANPPFFITGNGSHASPWNLRTFAAEKRTDSSQSPVIVSLGEDRDGFFQSSPPSPIDLAVILSNFQRLGARKAATGMVLAWDSPDPIGLLALDKTIARFDSLVMAAPLSRGAIPEAMPPAFRRASIPLESVRGDPSALPLVNRIPLTGVILGSDNTMAGFQFLDSEPASKYVPLLARWDDRVVFAMPLLCVLERYDLPVGGMIIRLGESIQLGAQGPLVPIDRYGRFVMPVKSLAPYAVIPAESMIDGGDTLIPPQALKPLVLRDDRSAAEPATRAFSKKLPALIAALASTTAQARARDVPRLHSNLEICVLLLLVLVLTASCSLAAFPRNIGFLVFAIATLAASYLAFGIANVWWPCLPALSAISVACFLSAIIRVPPARPPLVPIYPPRSQAKPRPHLAKFVR